MQAKLTDRPIQRVIAAIEDLDLEPVKQRMMDAELGEGWTRDYADGIERGYKNYLTMLAKYQDHAEDILLSKDVDEFWHTHILQTIKYTEDCERVFGRYLHHSPHIGERTPADLERRSILAEKTRRLYQQEFNGAQDYEAAWLGVQSGKIGPISARIERSEAAYSSAAIRSGKAAYSSASISAGKAAYSSTAIRGEDAAYSSAAIRAEKAAYSSASISAGKAAYSSAVIRGEDAAYSSAAIRAEEAAYSSASISAGKAAYSSAVIRGEDAAYSSAAIRAEKAAYSSAAVGADDSAQRSKLAVV